MKKFIILILIILLGVGGYFGYKHFFSSSDSTKTSKKIYTDKIEKFGYRLEKRDTKLYKEKFNELKEVLSKKNIDYKKYAKLLSELYIIDLYTLDNKLTTYDVGSTEFIYPDALENYELKVKDTLYKYMEDNSDGKRKQELPEVSSIKVGDITETTFDLKSTDDNGEKATEFSAYDVSLTWDYKKDLGYDKKAIVTLIKENKGKKLYVVEQKEKATDKDKDESTD